MARKNMPRSSCVEEVDDLKAELDQRIQELETGVRSRDSMALLERQMQVAGNTMAHVHVTLQAQVGSYNQEWQGVQTQQRQLDIERTLLAKDCHDARNNKSIMDGFAALQDRVENFYEQMQTNRKVGAGRAQD